MFRNFPLARLMINKDQEISFGRKLKTIESIELKNVLYIFQENKKYNLQS